MPSLKCLLMIHKWKKFYTTVSFEFYECERCGKIDLRGVE
jgi:hypothetical protein